MWILFHSFALFVNLADIEGKISDDSYVSQSNTSIDTIPKKVDTAGDAVRDKQLDSLIKGYSIHKPKHKHSSSHFVDSSEKTNSLLDEGGTIVDFNPQIHIEDITYLFTDGNTFNSSDFWPFTAYLITKEDGVSGYYTKTTCFGGIFNSYGFPEYIAYMLLGLAIVFIPKLWKENEPNELTLNSNTMDTLTYFGDDDNFESICKTITNRIFLLQPEYPDINVNSLWRFRLMKDNKRHFYVADDCIDAVLKDKITTIIKEVIST